MPTSEDFSLYMDASEKDFVAIAKLGDHIETGRIDSSRQTLERMFPLIISLAEKFGRKYADFDNVYVTLGPGSNTGLRMAITSARVFFALKPQTHVYGATTHDCLFKASGLNDCITLISDRHASFFYAQYKDGVLIGSGHSDHLSEVPGIVSNTAVYSSIDKDAHSACLSLQNSKEVSEWDALLADCYTEYTPDNVQSLVPNYSEKI